MDKQPYSDTHSSPFTDSQVTRHSASEFLRQVFAVMTLGLAITGMSAWFFGQQLLAGKMTFLLTSPINWIVMLAPLGFVLALSFGIHKMRFQTANLVFALYSAVNGISLSFIFLVYTQALIAKVFFITAATFGTMALIGYTTKVDLSRYRSILYMGLIGLLIAMVVNMFLGSSQLDYILSLVGVALFCGLTAYDMQKLTEMGETADMALESTRKWTIIGALALYLDFINLFLFLLRIFSGGRD